MENCIRSVWEVGELLLSHVAPADDAHHVLPRHVRDPVTGGDRCEGGGPGRLDHQTRPVEHRHGRLDLLVAHQHDLIHVAATQLVGKSAWWPGKKCQRLKFTIKALSLPWADQITTLGPSINLQSSGKPVFTKTVRRWSQEAEDRLGCSL